MARGLRSLEQQIYREFEVIFVDDCSTDDTYQRLLEYQNTSILCVKVLKNKSNSGPGQSRNNAIKQARGEYLAFLDSDDWYEENLLQEVYEAIKKEQADLVFFDFYRAYSERKKKAMPMNNPLLEARSKSDFIALCYDALWGMCVHKNAFKDLEIPHLYNAEDAVTIPLLVSKVDKITVIHKPLYNYHYRINSLSSSKNKAISVSILQAFSLLEENLDQSERVAMEYRGILMVLYAYVYKAMQSNSSVRDISFVVDSFLNKYPRCLKNPYFQWLTLRKRLFVKCVKYRFWFLLHTYIWLQDFLISFPAKLRKLK